MASKIRNTKNAWNTIMKKERMIKEKIFLSHYFFIYLNLFDKSNNHYYFLKWVKKLYRDDKRFYRIK
ncbi:hypothetical protein LH67_17010 [Xenorhabdus nematophila]|nr:hypothetical protein LH67_17010 [Xenorhabdus nematophila]